MYIQLVVPLLEGLRVLPFGNIVIHKIMTNFPEIMNYININININNYYQNMNNLGMGFNNINHMIYMNMNQINMRFNN